MSHVWSFGARRPALVQAKKQMRARQHEEAKRARLLEHAQQRLDLLYAMMEPGELGVDFDDLSQQEMTERWEDAMVRPLRFSAGGSAGPSG